MSKIPNLRKGDKIKICGEEYRLVDNLSPLKGFQFRTWLVEKIPGKKKYVAKITPKQNMALGELRVYIYLKNRRYPDRYYTEMITFDHEAQLSRDNHIKYQRFCVILLKYLPTERFQHLDEYLKNRLSKNIRQRVKDKLKRRVKKLHELGIAHNDIREANIMVGTKSKRRAGVRLIDFGLSKFNDEEAKEKDRKRIFNIVKKILKD